VEVCLNDHVANYWIGPCDVAEYVKEKYPEAVGFTMHPFWPLPKYRLVSAFLVEGDHSPKQDSWPLYLFNDRPHLEEITEEGDKAPCAALCTMI